MGIFAAANLFAFLLSSSFICVPSSANSLLLSADFMSSSVLRFASRIPLFMFSAEAISWLIAAKSIIGSSALANSSCSVRNCVSIPSPFSCSFSAFASCSFNDAMRPLFFSNFSAKALMSLVIPSILLAISVCSALCTVATVSFSVSLLIDISSSGISGKT
ncbi:hypothetical protein ES703_62884 [subsurface metagenome]